MVVVNSKIRLPEEMPLLSRPRLLNHLRESVRCCTSTLITARAGSGKTLLCADFARGSGRRVAWFKVDSSEMELRTFIYYLIASVQLAWPRFGQHTIELLNRHSAQIEAHRYAESLLCDLTEECAQALLVVIDDLHLVYDAEWLVPFFKRLLPLLPPEAHFILTGRSALPAPLWRMRSKQTLCFIDEAELALTLGEVETLFSYCGLSKEDAQKALEETRGRAALLNAWLTPVLAKIDEKNLRKQDLVPECCRRERRYRSSLEISRFGQARVKRQFRH